MSKTILHKAASRGNADHGWLHSRHSFSFAGYYNPERMHFGVLRVLNDDVVAAGRGFGTHPHNNMEIISLPLEGDLEHKDSMGTTAVIKSGDIQVMSAGTGVQHSEYNKSSEHPVKFLQIWVIPNKQNVTPRYDQMRLNTEHAKNKIQQLISPDPSDEGLWIHQDAWFSMGNFDKDFSADYVIKRKGNGVYLFVLEGSIRVNDILLEGRDALGIWDTDHFTITAITDARFLLMDVPMTLPG